MRGISPVIATVIILAVTIAIAIAVVGWVMGIFRSSSSGMPQLTIIPNGTLTCSSSSATVKLWVKNSGTAAAHIISVTIEGVGSTSVDVTINPGEIKEVDATITNNGCTAGASYQVTLATDAGTSVSTVLVAS